MPLSTTNVLIPDDVAAKIEVDTNLSAFYVGEIRFPEAAVRSLPIKMVEGTFRSALH